MKLTTIETVYTWQTQIEQSPEKQITLDFTEQMVQIYTRIILKALFGEDVSD